MASPIAIVGISAEFPSGKAHDRNLDHEAFFEFLLKKGQAYEKIPSERFNIESWKGPHSGQVITDTGSFLKDTSHFDHLEFGITAVDARNMSLSTRKLIEHSFLALLDSGIDYRGRNVGCFTSGVSFDLTTIGEPDEMDARGSFAGYPYMIANKVSYHLDLRGPSVPTDTACSSTLTALHLAVQSIRAGECEAAVVGGCQLNYRLIDFIQYSQGGILSPDGKCKPFDESANGFGRGEGVCTIVIKPLEDAIRDGDPIYASILGTGINSSGGEAPVSAPVATAQEDAMRRAYMHTGRRPSEADFLELHATDEGELLIGSVKGNIGHLEITAFLASLSKVCSILRTGLVPPNVNLSRANPSIHWDNIIFVLQPRSSSGKLLISMTSSGIGGVNGHVVLESPPQRMAVLTNSDSTLPILVCIGGLSPRSASQVASDVQELIVKGEFSEDTAIVYRRRCRQMTWRTYAVFDLMKVSRPPSFPDPVLIPRTKPPLVFVFSGQGPQHVNIFAILCVTFQRLLQAIQQLDDIHARITGYSLVRDIGLFDESGIACMLPEIWPIAITLPALCIIQIALFELIKSFGVHPDAIVGHSAGEAAVLYASGATSRDLAIEISIARGIAMSQLEVADSAMAAVNCSIEEADAIRSEVSLLKKESDILDVACHNSHSAFVFSGTRSLVEKAVEVAKSRGIFTRLLRTRIPVHSGLMDLCQHKYQGLVTEAFERHSNSSHTFHPRITTYSCLNGKRWSNAFTPDYIWSTARNPVFFSQSVASILRDMPTACFLEISPHPVLTSYISDLVGTGENTVLASLKRAKESEVEPLEIFTLLSALGKIATLGYNITATPSALSCDISDLNIRVPPYPFSKKEVEYVSRSSNTLTRQMSTKSPLYDPSNDLRLNSLSHPDIAQHAIRGESIMPAAGYIEMAFESGAHELWNVHFKSIMPFPRENYLSVKLLSSGPYWQVFSSPSNQRLVSKHMLNRLHAEGYLSTNPPVNLEEKAVPVLDIMDRCRKINVHKFYENLRYFAGYGPIFQRVQSCYLNDNEALVKVRACADDITNLNRYVIHPAILDSSFHIMVSSSFTGNSDRFGYYLPSGVQTVSLYRPNYFRENSPQAVYSYVQLTSWEPEHIDFNFSLLDLHGNVICRMQGFRVSWHNIEQNQLHRRGYDLTHIPIEPSSVANAEIYLEKQKRLHLEDENLLTSTIISFKRDSVLDLQRGIAELKRSDSGRLWIEATIGLDGYTAQGLVRSLSREITGIKLTLILFHHTWGEQDRKAIVHGLSGLTEIESEIIVDAEGTLNYPRIVPSVTQIHNNNDLKAEDLWAWNDEKKMLNIASGKTLCHTRGVLVRFESVSLDTAGGLRSFFGTVVQSAIENISPGVTVAGITPSDTFANHAIIQDGHFLPVSKSEKPVCDLILPFVVIRFATSSRLIQDSSYRDNVDNLIIRHTHTQSLSSEIERGGVLISSINDKNEIHAIQRLSREKIPMFFFNDEFNGLLRMVNADPWSVSETLQTILPLLPSLKNVEGVSVDPMTLLPEKPVVIHSDLFNGTKSYLIVGGIGSLGLQVALWMYQNGARNLILTSRRGASSLEDRKDLMAQRILYYLKSRPELELRLEACDATSQQEVSKLIEGIQTPIAGCLLMSVVLSDRLFMSHAKETYYVPFSPKLGAFEALSRVIDIQTLDFLVSFSSAAVFGNPGQTNYASANTQLDGVLSSYANAFSLVCPAIIDSITISHGDALLPDTRYHNWIPWAMSSKQICECLGDGIRKLTTEPFTHYIPEFDWNQVQRHFGNSPMYDSLVTKTDDESTVNSVDSVKTLSDTVAKHLDMDVDDLASNVPLTAYGLDSLSAGRLAYALKSLVSVTQLQLLGDMTLQDLQKLSEQLSGNRDEDLSPTLNKGFDWVDLNRPGETLVKLVEGDENPLILIHGGTGVIAAFIPLQERLKTAFWAIQSTPDAPRESISETASYYCAKIKEERPTGPYRIASYCASSLLTFEIVRILELNGDHISQFILLDHFPSLFVSPLFPLDDESLETGKPSDALIEAAFISLCNCYNRDPGQGRERVMGELMSAHRGSKGRPFIEFSYQYFLDCVSACLKFLLEIGGSGQRYNSSNVHLLRERLKAWLEGISSSVTVVVATSGMSAELMRESPEWHGLGANNFTSKAEVVEIPYGHFGMFESEELAVLLEKNLAGL
ncbi:hypothetical protein BDQ17DRAFT_1393106 [Cyathus striatus]|nr:hypothetical protein BDQ17DRAFT_1393106 [Cyathus striatus]